MDKTQLKKDILAEIKAAENGIAGVYALYNEIVATSKVTITGIP